MAWVADAGPDSALGTLDAPAEAAPLTVVGETPADRLLEAGLVAHQEGKLERALAAYRQVLGLDAENVPAMAAAALIHADRGEHEAAEFLLRRSIAIAPTCVAYNSLGTILTGRRQWDAAITCYRASLALDPQNLTTWPNLLFALDLHPHATPRLRLAERRRFNDLHCRALTAAAAPHENDPDPDRVLRVGYVSADFKQHSAAHGFGPVLLGHHPAAVEVYLYDVDQGVLPPDDQLKPWFRSLARRWCAAGALSDHTLAEQVRADGIDILVDLSGYSAGGRALAFAEKPAPIQVGGLGYATGTGIDAMDYLLADAVTVPPAHERWYHERILRLPVFMGYEQAPPWPEVGPPPKARTGHVTYGYCGRALKLSPQTLAAWAEILGRVPDSRLLLKIGDLSDQGMLAQMRGTLEALGVAADRVEVRGGSPRYAHLEAYGEVDVSLDPFPHGGGVTTIESLLMGVPTVTLLGADIPGRTGASFLTLLGFKPAVARSVHEYVEHAVAMADEPWTHDDRRALRRRLVDSIMFDPDRYASAVEDAYRAAWRAWTSGRVRTGGAG